VVEPVADLKTTTAGDRRHGKPVTELHDRNEPSQRLQTCTPQQPARLR
jgi:hypothetical protein